MKRIVLQLILLLLPLTLSAKIKVVASTSDLAYFTEKIGGELVEVTYIAPPASDIHFIEARPSYMMKTARADLALKIGLELDQWMDPIIDGSRNNHLVVIDCSKYIKPLEVPSFKADARYGDLHQFGNPHYWLTPENAKPITDAIVEGLSRVDVKHSEQFLVSQEKLLNDIAKFVESLQPKLKQLEGARIIFYHNSWPYFSEFTQIHAVEFIEPYPRVAPSPAQVKKLIDLANTGRVKVIAMEPYFDKRVPEKIAAETGAKVIVLYPSIGGREKNETYQSWIESNIDAIIEALK